MRNLLKTIGIAGLLAVTAGAASAQQFNIDLGGGVDRQERMERRMDRRMDRRIDRDIDDVGSVERRTIIRTQPEVRTRIIERNVVRERPQYVVCRTVTKVTRVGNTIIRRPGEECTRRVVSTRRVIVR
jgi:hypothetical protein